MGERVACTNAPLCVLGPHHRGACAALPPDRFPNVQAALDSLSDDLERRVALVRLAMRLNNGDEHFDHGEPGYSWLCLKCAAMGRRGLNGWVGALQMLAHITKDGGEG